ncbi:MAG: DarT ssDNA thymidine ADP-ribosyltransferase family protein [Clostridia bacterium]
MTFAEIINDNCEQHSCVNWWPRYAYHVTDITNAMGILASECLYSRVQARSKGVMQNDNASRQVIDITATQTMAYVRFYFRPLTPTQYYNEGFKHRKLRYQDDRYANMPVPIFFLFDLEKLLSMPETLFSPVSQAGGGGQLMKGATAFSQMPFDKIYSRGAADKETTSYRHAEILYPQAFAIRDTLRAIYCRNECDKLTLLNLLRDKNRIAYDKYKAYVRVALDDVYQRNGLFVKSVAFCDDVIAFAFSDNLEKRAYAQRHLSSGEKLEDVDAVFSFEWFHKTNLLHSVFYEAKLRYLDTQPVTIKLPHIPNARTLRATLRVEEKLLCVFEQPLASFELI